MAQEHAARIHRPGGAAMLACLLGAAGGCGNDGPDKASTFCQQANAIDGVLAARCFGGTAAKWSAYVHRDCSLLDQAVADHLATYDRGKANDCLAELNVQATHVDCATVFPSYGTCLGDVVAGTVALGQPCQNTFVCAGAKSFCAPPATATDPCAPSICQNPPTVGESCPQFQCQDGAGCSAAMICVANGKLGDQCGAATATTCDVGLHCDIGNQCATKRAGGTCASVLDCFEYQFCDTATGSCRDRSKVGAPCARDGFSCDTFLFCDPTTATCAEGGHLGQPCGEYLGTPAFCLEGSCFQDTDQVYRCLAADPAGAPAGTACTMSSDCASSLCSQGQCVAACPK
jgi:hypothetical protein